jgi:hypothetical protein
MSTSAPGGISPWTVGQLSPLWTLPMTRDNGKVMDLTGVTTGQLSLIIYTSSKTLASNSPGVGTFTIEQVKPGIVTYQLASADVPSTAGQYWVRVKVNFGGTLPDFCDYISWIIQN